jgi:hypothetical protein
LFAAATMLHSSWPAASHGECASSHRARARWGRTVTSAATESTQAVLTHFLPQTSHFEVPVASECPRPSAARGARSVPACSVRASSPEQTRKKICQPQDLLLGARAPPQSARYGREARGVLTSVLSPSDSRCITSRAQHAGAAPACIAGAARIRLAPKARNPPSRRDVGRPCFRPVRHEPHLSVYIRRQGSAKTTLMPLWRRIEAPLLRLRSSLGVQAPCFLRFPFRPLLAPP